jgi:hypothetical protein
LESEVEGDGKIYALFRVEAGKIFSCTEGHKWVVKFSHTFLEPA